MRDGPARPSAVTQAIPGDTSAAAETLQLEAARLVTSAKRGRERIWTVQPKSLTAAGDYLGALSRRWDRRIDRLRALVEDGS